MQIQKVNLYPIQSQLISKKNSNKPPVCTVRQYNYIPAAYQDFNITFGAQINRTPANFYAFNKKNLPDAMRNYLNGDYEDRQNMPPAQMMRYVYRGLNDKDVDSLDIVKRLYAEKEPLFAELTDTPTRKARKGLVSQVETLKEEFGDAPLFKDGTSNLGLYLLRKIYLEGKQRKEINEEFYKDLSKEYDGLITEPVDYSTFSAYGIKFPKVPFWNSFVVTREDWNYEYKPRKSEDSGLSTGAKRELTLNDILSGKVPPSVKPPKFKIEKHKVERMTDAVLNGHGDSDATAKLLKRKGVVDKEEISFVSRYLGQIMSVALEKIHASDEMRSFFESYDDLSKSQRKKFESYWRANPQMRQLQSLAISDTIKLFFETYGADGNNEEFQELLTYADSIKPARELRDMLHNKKQAEYDELFAELDKADGLSESDEIQTETVESKLNNMSEEELNHLLELEAMKNGAKVFRFNTPDGKQLMYVCNVDEMFEKHLREDMILLPSQFVNRYYRFMKNSPLATDRYKETVALRSDVDDSVKDQLLSVEELRNISKEINKTYNEKYPYGIFACDQSLVELVLEKLPPNQEYAKMLNFDTSSIIEFIDDTLGISKWDDRDLSRLNKLYSEYSTPISSREELHRINNILVDYICEGNVQLSKNEDPVFGDLTKLMSANLRRNPKYRNVLEKMIRQTNFIEHVGGTSRLLLKSEAPKILKDEKCAQLVSQLIQTRLDELMPLLTLSTINIQNCISDDAIRDTLMMKAVLTNNKLFS